jgi:hypothetical protein
MPSPIINRNSSTITNRSISTVHLHYYPFMGATLRHTAIHRRRHRRAKRLKLRRRLVRAAPGERQAIQAKIAKTYPLTPPP